MGGMIAQCVALNHPGRTASLVSIMSSTGRPGLPPAKPEAIVADLAQEAHPYTAKNLNDTMKELAAQVDQALLDLNRQVDQAMGK